MSKLGDKQNGDEKTMLFLQKCVVNVQDCRYSYASTFMYLIPNTTIQRSPLRKINNTTFKIKMAAPSKGTKLIDIEKEVSEWLDANVEYGQKTDIKNQKGFRCVHNSESDFFTRAISSNFSKLLMIQIIIASE